MRRVIPIVAMLALGAFCHADDIRGKVFSETDKNHDKKLTAKEFVQAVQTVAYAELDKDKNGRIELKEWVVRENGKDSEVLFKKLDVNQDGTVSLEEFCSDSNRRGQLEKMFETIDKNGDGVVTVEEIEAQPKN